MHRVMLFALVLSALLWTGAARTGSVSNDIVTTSELESCLVAGNPQEPGDSDRQWRARPHTIAPVTESIWKSALVHAELAATPLARVFDIARAACSPDPPIRPAPHFLRHTPLLI